MLQPHLKLTNNTLGFIVLSLRSINKTLLAQTTRSQHGQLRQLGSTAAFEGTGFDPGSRGAPKVTTHSDSDSDIHNEGRKHSSSYGFKNSKRSMKAWEIHSYGGPEELQLNPAARIPLLRNPQEVLIQVKAASVNPIDVEMSRGYGSNIFHALRELEKGNIMGMWRNTIDFPLTLGRDFAGIVVEKGPGVKNLNVGDHVFGVLRFTEHGSHAEYTVARSDLVQIKPSHLSFAEASSFPYVGLTAWAALRIVGKFCDLTDKKFLILGGSGGVGTFVVQYLQAEGAAVVATCSADAMPLLESLGVFNVVDYRSPACLQELKSNAPYDCILNLTGSTGKDLSQYWSLLKPIRGQYISMSPPSLSNFGQYGFVGGMLKNATDLVRNNVNSFSKDHVVTKWGFFMPSAVGLREITNLISRRQIRPVIQESFAFVDLPQAYNRVAEGHLRGKTVIEF